MHARRIIALSLDVLERAANLLIESDNAVSRFDKRDYRTQTTPMAALDLLKAIRWTASSFRSDFRRERLAQPDAPTDRLFRFCWIRLVGETCRFPGILSCPP
jgi:hypothetical protein